jgi:hypothetical protein
MKNYIIKKFKLFLKDLIKEFILEIINNRIMFLREVVKKNERDYNEIDYILMQAKIQALEEAYTILTSALDG